MLQLSACVNALQCAAFAAYIFFPQKKETLSLSVSPKESAAARWHMQTATAHNSNSTMQCQCSKQWQALVDADLQQCCQRPQQQQQQQQPLVQACCITKTKPASIAAVAAVLITQPPFFILGKYKRQSPCMSLPLLLLLLLSAGLSTAPRLFLAPVASTVCIQRVQSATRC
jgi:hypothetical protein